MKFIMITAAALSMFSTAVLAEDRPLWDPQAGSPMDFTIHSQPAKYPHHLGERSQGTFGKPAQVVPLSPRAPTVAEKAWMDRASRDASGN